MQSEMPFFESPEEALRAAVQALGKPKDVGVRLWPHLSPDAAGRKLSDCLNTDRAEVLKLSEAMCILRWAREVGAHTAMQWLAADVGYEARPVTRADQVDQAAQAVENAARALSLATVQLERVQRLRAAA